MYRKSSEIYPGRRSSRHKADARILVLLAMLLGACAGGEMSEKQAGARSDKQLCDEMSELADIYTDIARNGGYTNLEGVKKRISVISAEVERRGIRCT